MSIKSAAIKVLDDLAKHGSVAPLDAPSREKLTIFRTPNPRCPACQALRRHTGGEFIEFHPLARTSGPGAQSRNI
jgi:hypothetical protein